MDKYLPEDENFVQLQVFDPYPNPNEGVFSFKILSNNKCKLKIEMLSVGGQSFYNDILLIDNTLTVYVNIPNIPKGLYILKLTGDRTLINKKIIIK